MTFERIADTRKTDPKCLGWLEACWFVSVASLIAQLSPAAVSVYYDWPRLGPQTTERADLKNAEGNSWQVQYIVSLPQGYSADLPAPLLLYLHGGGQRGDDIKQVLRWGLPQQIGWGLRVPMIVVSPQCRSDLGWDSHQLLVLLDHLQEQLAIDPKRIYVTGESMGGNGTWNLCAAAPERFAAAVPICGGGDIQTAPLLARLPIWAFHGARDQVVSPERSKRMVDVIQAAGGSARLTIYPEEGHGVSKRVFTRDDLYAWLLDQKRPD